MLQFVSSEEAIKEIKSNDHVFIHSVAQTPQSLVKSLIERHQELKNVHIYHIHTEGECGYAKEEYRESFKVHSFFNGSNMRKATNNHLSPMYVPIFLSDIPHLFYNGNVKLDVALVQVSPPDKHGMCSLGPSVDISIAAVRTAKKIIAQVNPNVPRTFGDTTLHYSKITKAVYSEEELYLAHPAEITPVQANIGKHVASLIEDGSTLQMGIGAIPNAVLELLNNHKDLGIHTEMFSDGILPLVEKGVITGSQKKIFPGKIISSFVLGSRKIYDFIDNNMQVNLLDCSYTNNTVVIRENPKVIAINSAIEVDLSGQVCADSIGGQIYSGVGGQMDFMRGAALSKGGKAIIALPSTTNKGESKIVPFLKHGAGVTTTRAHVQYIITEHGIAKLHGLTIEERARELIKIAAPQHREELEKQFKKLYY